MKLLDTATGSDASVNMSQGSQDGSRFALGSNPFPGFRVAFERWRPSFWAAFGA